MNTWDERKRLRDLKDHGIDFADLEDFFGGDLLTREDLREAYGERRPIRGMDPTGQRRRNSSLYFSQKGRKS